MKKIRIIMLKYHLCTILAISFLLFSCSREEIVGNNTDYVGKANLKSTVRTNTYTDEEVFKGVMFLEGSVSNRLHNFKSFNFRSYITDPVEIAEILQLQSDILVIMKTSNPKYFEEFRSKVGSGDYYLVKDAIQNAANEISKAAVQIAQQNGNKTNSIASKFSKSFTSQNEINENSTRAELLTALKSLQSHDNDSSKVEPYKYVYIWLFAAAAAVIVILLFAAEQPINGKLVNNYLIDDLQSTITLEFKGI